MKRIQLSVIALGFISVLAGGCSVKVNSSLSSGGTGSITANVGTQPTVTQITLTDNPKTKEEKDAFTPKTAKIFVITAVAGTNEGDKVKTAFVCDQAVDPANQKPIKNLTINSVTLTLKSGMDQVNADLSKPTNGWPVGDYHIEVYINDRLAKTAKFTIADVKS